MADIIMTISLRKKLVRLNEPKRRNKTVIYLREHVARLSKVDVSAVKIDGKLNNQIMLKYGKSMERIRVKVSKDAGLVKVSLPEEPKPAAPAGKNEPAKKQSESKKIENAAKPQEKPNEKKEKSQNK